jgi:hypothetical protein
MALLPALRLRRFVQPVNDLVTAFPAQDGFCLRPVVHQGHDLALARPPYKAHLSAILHRRHCVSAFSSIHQTASNRPLSPNSGSLSYPVGGVLPPSDLCFPHLFDSLALCQV